MFEIDMCQVNKCAQLESAEKEILIKMEFLDTKNYSIIHKESFIYIIYYYYYYLYNLL